ncbi:MAG: tetraacyldisaccharide 4'-kinase [Crocinitomicaceae bacterium]|nr:tetraacyldisaccharide 4'-kinase [Crocinitomicaceae bacterium]
MKKLRLLLLPIGWLYGVITGIRNSLYSHGVLKSYEIPQKSIVIGNLSTGGTGKTPHVDYLLNYYINAQYKVSSLSRGYGRKSKGVLLATDQSTSDEIGDEPLLYKFRHGSSVNVVVAESRKDGVDFIGDKFPDNDIIILDDAFQHRAVKAGVNILISEYDHLYCDDYILPAGNLREWKYGAKRSDLLIVSKCPPDMTSEEKEQVRKKLNYPGKHIFFSSIIYDQLIPLNPNVDSSFSTIVLVTGIANPTPLIKHLEKQAKVEHLSFGDHHEFKRGDIERIHEKFDTFASSDKIIVTTEKDYMRLLKFDQVKDENYRWHYQPITLNIDNEQKFNSLLDEYIGKF